MSKPKFSIPISRVNLHVDPSNPKLVAFETNEKEDSNYFCEFTTKVTYCNHFEP